jgi:hypothetical protein
VNWFPLVLVVHIALAISLLLPSVVLPFLLRRTEPGAQPRGAGTRLLMAIQGTGSLVIGAGLAVSGATLVAMLGTEILAKPWLLVALIIYAANLLVAGLVSRPNLRRLLRLEHGDDEAWRRRARRQRWVAYGMAAATGAIGLLMSTKPDLW